MADLGGGGGGLVVRTPLSSEVLMAIADWLLQYKLSHILFCKKKMLMHANSTPPPPLHKKSRSAPGACKCFPSYSCSLCAFLQGVNSNTSPGGISKSIFKCLLYCTIFNNVAHIIICTAKFDPNVYLHPFKSTGTGNDKLLHNYLILVGYNYALWWTIQSKDH